MSARSFASARLMETWAHGQDVWDVVGRVRPASSRLKHIAHLGVTTFKWTFVNRKLPVPDVLPHIELTAPDGSLWRWNENSSDHFVRGSAVDFCLLVTQRRHWHDTDLVHGGEEVGRWLSMAAMFCGSTGRRTASRQTGSSGLSMVKADTGCALTLDLRPTIDALLYALHRGQGEQTLADPNFANLFLFRAVHRYRFLSGDWPCISGRSYDGLSHLLPLFDLRTAPADVLRDVLNGHNVFFPVSGFQLEGLDRHVFEWTASRDDADYVYPAQQFVHYSGSLLHKKRNLVKQLHSTHLVPDPVGDSMAELRTGPGHCHRAIEPKLIARQFSRRFPYTRNPSPRGCVCS